MKFRRTSFQFGGLELKSRKRGPNVWAYRYRQLQPDGTVRQKSKVIGTIEQYPTKSQAWKAAEVYRMSANPDNPAQHGVSWGALIDRYIETDLPRREDTARTYRACLENHIRPKWGDYALGDVKPFSLEEWLRKATVLDGSRKLSWKSKKHLRSLMHILYGCAMRWEFAPIGANPFGNRLIRIDKGTKKKRRSLTLEQFNALLQHRLISKEPFRTMVMVAICLGLRCSEIFGLRWGDISWEDLTLSVQRRVVRGVLDLPKSEHSETLLPLAAELAEVLFRWKRRSRFKGAEHFVFASPKSGGKTPYDPVWIQQKRLRPAGKDIGFLDSLGWHNLRHTYRTFLDETGAPMSVQQELMRHADIRTTFEYGEALSPSKRKANLKVVKMFLAGTNGSRGKKGGR